MKNSILLVILSYMLFSALIPKIPSDDYSQTNLLKQRVAYIRIESKVKDTFNKVGEQINKEPDMFTKRH